MRSKGDNTNAELLDSLQQRIQTEKSLLQRRLDQRPPAPGRPRSQERRRRPRRTGRLYQVFLALGVPDGES